MIDWNWSVKFENYSNLTHIFSMKRISYILLISVVCSCSQSTSKKTSLQEVGLKGNVSEVITAVYDAESKFGDIVKDDDVRFVIDDIYNEQGYLIEKTEYNEIEMSSDNIDSRDRYTYDDKNNLLEVAHYGHNGKLIYKVTQKFESGKIIFSTYNSFGEITTTEYHYKDGKISDFTVISNDSKHFYFNFYNKKEYENAITNELSEIRLWNYKSGHMLAQKSKNHNIEMAENEKGDYISYKDIENNRECSFSYDKKGNLAKISGACLSKWRIDLFLGEYLFYNISLLNFDKLAYTSINYEYDKNGNWIKAIFESSNDGKDIFEYSIIERFIK